MAVVNLPDRELAAWAFGVLDPGDAAWLAARAGPVERLRAAGMAACAGVAAPCGVPPLRAEGLAAPLLSAEAVLRAGDRIALPLAWAGALHETRVAIFRTAGAVVERIFPRDESWPTLAAFPHRYGRPVADIVLAPPAGRQRFDLVLVHETLAAAPWSEHGLWERLRAAYAAGALPGVTVEVAVEA